jgi:SAD/SRA domain
LRERGVSGNQKVGCNAIVVSGKKHQEHSEDSFVGLAYAATSREGALAMKRSWEKGYPIRVFRSSTYESKYCARPPDDCKRNATFYRYDGLYEIYDVLPIESPNGTIYKFLMAQEELRCSSRFLACQPVQKKQKTC